MSNDGWAARYIDLNEFSYGTNENLSAGIYINREYLDDISEVVQNNPGIIGETINDNLEVVRTFDELNWPQQNSAIITRSLSHTDVSNGIPQSLDVEHDEPVVQSYSGNNTDHRPSNIDKFVNIPNTRNKRSSNLYTNPYIFISLQHLIPTKRIKSGQLSPQNGVLNAIRSPGRYQGHNHNDVHIQGHRHSSTVPPNSPRRCESITKYCRPIDGQCVTFNAAMRDPRLKNRVKYEYKHVLDNVEGLRPLRYENKQIYLDEDLKTINMNLKNMNSSYNFSVVNDLCSQDNFNEHNIRHQGGQCVQNALNQESETENCNKHNNLKNFRYQHLNVGKLIDAIDLRNDNVNEVNDIASTRTSNASKQYLKQKNAHEKSSDDEQNQLSKTIKNIIDSLSNSNISDSKCSTTTLSKTNDMIKTRVLNNQTKNNNKKSNKNILTVKNSNFDNKHQNIDNIYGVTEFDQNHKRPTEQSIEVIDLTYDTPIVRTEKRVDTGTFILKLKDVLSTITVNSENAEKLNENNHETNAEKITINEDHSVADQHKTFKKKLHKHESKNRNEFKDNIKYSDAGNIKIDSAFKNTNSELAINSGQVSNEQSNNAGTKLLKPQKKTDQNELINELIVQLENENSNINNIFMKNRCNLIENIQNEISSFAESINREISVGVKSNANISNECATSVTNISEKTRFAHDQLSIRVQDSNKTTEANFNDRVSHNKNCGPSIGFKKLNSGTYRVIERDTNEEDSFKSNTVQSLPNPELLGSFENVDDEQSTLYDTEYQNANTSETDIYESTKDGSQSQTVNSMFDNTPPVGRGYNQTLNVEKEVPPHFNLSEQILNENSVSFDSNDFNNCLSQTKQENPKYGRRLIIDTEDTDRTGLNEPFEDTNQSTRHSFISDGGPDGHNFVYGSNIEDSLDSFCEYILNENSVAPVTSESNKEGSTIEQTMTFVESEGIESIEIIDDVLSADKSPIDEPPADEPPADEPPADEPPANVQPVGEHFEMDYFYNIIKIKQNVFRVNLHTEDDIFNFIQLYSQRTQTSWRVLKSLKSRKYDVCKIFGCLHNGLFKLLKKPVKKMKLNKCDCKSEIDIKIKCSTTRGKKVDPYLKNGLPAIVRFNNEHNHLVSKVTELPLLKSITDSNVEITFDKGFDPAKIRQACNIGNRPKISPPSVVDITNSSDDDVEIIETTDRNESDQITGNNLFSKWEYVKIQCNVVVTKNNKCLQPGQQVVNNGERANVDGTPHQLVDTSYNKDYSHKLQDMISNKVKAKWIGDKMTTEADQMSLYKCSGKKCNAVFSYRKTFVLHLNDHCYNAKSQKDTQQFTMCMYCFKTFNTVDIDALANHIFDNYSFCKYFCQYCLYRAYTASHVLVHEYLIHRERKPSILTLKNRTVDDNSKEIVKVVDFKPFVLSYVCNLGNCNFNTYMSSDFLYHLSYDHVECDEFYCDICDECNGSEFVAFNPISFVKHFSLHNINTYQCIYCLFGAESINRMMIHLAMEHFEYEPLCLERSLINKFSDVKNIEDLKILNIKKFIPSDIIKVVNGKSLKDLNKNIYHTDSTDTCTNIDIDNTTRFSRSSIKEVVHPLKNALKPPIDNKHKTIKSDEAKSNVQRDDAQRIPNVGASNVNVKKKSSQLSIYEIMNNLELKKKIGKQFKEKVIITPSSNKPNDWSKKHANNRLDNKSQINEIHKKVPGNKLINTKTVNIENTGTVLRKSTRNVVHSSKNIINLDTDNENDTIVPHKAKTNIPRDDVQRIPNSEASIENDQNKSSELTIHDVIKNIKLKKGIKLPIKKRSLETPSSDELVYQHELISNTSSDKAMPAGISYQEHLSSCPMDSPMRCSFCLAQSESTFDVVKIPKPIVPNRFTCTFCDLTLPSSDVAKSHVKEVHNVSYVEFVPININATDIEKDRFLVCEDTRLKRQKRANDSRSCTDSQKNMAIPHTKRSKVVDKHDDLQLTTIDNSKNTSERQISRNPHESEQQQKTTKRKHTAESSNNATDVDCKKTPCWKRLYDTASSVTISMYCSPHNTDNVPKTDYFLKPIGCLLCQYHTKVRSNLMSHLNRHLKDPVVSNKQISKSVPYKLKPATTAFAPVGNSFYSSLKAKQYEKARTVDYSTYESTSNTISPPLCNSVNHIPKYVSKKKLFQCPLPTCNFIGEDMEQLGHHIMKHQRKCWPYVCPHCKPKNVTFESIDELGWHFNFHGIDLYECPYCDYIHYNSSKIESHQRRKHQLGMDDENQLNVVMIRKSKYPDLDTSKWKCNLCNSGIKYTQPEIAAHLLITHKISNMFKCTICLFNHSDFEEFEEHFLSNHPSREVKHLTVHFERIGPDEELKPDDKETDVNKHALSNERHSLNVPKAFGGVAKPTPPLPPPQKTPIKSTPEGKTSAESLDVSKNQGKILDNPSNEPDDSLELISPVAKYECPICNMFTVEKEESFRKHLLQEINSTLWKCFECLTISNSVGKMKLHVLQHDHLKRKFEKIEISKKNRLVDGIIEIQNMLMENKLLKRNNQHNNIDCDDQNGPNHGNV